MKRLTDEELAFIQKNVELLTQKDIAEQLGRSTGCIRRALIANSWGGYGAPADEDGSDGMEDVEVTAIAVCLTALRPLETAAIRRSLSYLQLRLAPRPE